MKANKIILRILTILPALIMLQTLYFKFTAAPESVYIFEKTGLGTPGRIGTGIMELIASALLLIPATTWIGALLATGLMSGALFSHLTTLGVEVMNDGGQLFIYALLVWICSIILLIMYRSVMMMHLRNIFRKHAV